VASYDEIASFQSAATASPDGYPSQSRRPARGCVLGSVAAPLVFLTAMIAERVRASGGLRIRRPANVGTCRGRCAPPQGFCLVMVLQGRRVRCEDGTVIGRLHHVIVDWPDPAALAAFYPELLGLPVTWQEEDFAVVLRDDTSPGVGFQLAPGFRPPQRPQQLHFDVMVDDVEAAEPRVLALAARRLEGEDSRSRVYADPAGHPFCLIPGPAWAAPIGEPPGSEQLP
jgi:catechol 2,3-dioxygenase-like lactoylglutathione lyase family enzyme